MNLHTTLVNSTWSESSESSGYICAESCDGSCKDKLELTFLRSTRSVRSVFGCKTKRLRHRLSASVSCRRLKNLNVKCLENQNYSVQVKYRFKNTKQSEMTHIKVYEMYEKNEEIFTLLFCGLRKMLFDCLWIEDVKLLQSVNV